MGDQKKAYSIQAKNLAQRGDALGAIRRTGRFAYEIKAPRETGYGDLRPGMRRGVEGGFGNDREGEGNSDHQRPDAYKRSVS